MSNIFYTLVFSKGTKLIYEVQDTPIAKKWTELLIATMNSRFNSYPTGWWAHPDYNAEYFEKIWEKMFLDVCAWNNSEVQQLKSRNMNEDPAYQLGDYKKWRFYKHSYRKEPYIVPEEFHIKMEQKCPPRETKKEQEKLQIILNDLHERFHEISEEMSSWIKPNRVLIADSPLNRLNTDIHTLEHLLHQTNNTVHHSNNCCFYLDGPTKWDKHSTPLTEEDYKTFNYTANHGDMIVGYHTVGKNLQHCWHDNDIVLVKKGMVRPQLKLSTEVICIFSQEENLTDHTDQSHQIEKMWDWVVENNLSEYVDKNDIRHSANYGPCVAKIINPITMEEINKIYHEEKLKHVELVDQNTMLKWKSDDYRY